MAAEKDLKVYAKTFQKAAELAGGPRQLGNQLHVPLADLQKWLAGETQPPLAIFLRAIDYVLNETAPD